MDFVNKAMGGGNSQNTQGQGTGNSVNEQVANDKSSGGGFLSGIGDKLNSAAGGGKESEKNEDYLDKGMSSCTHLMLPSTHLPSSHIRFSILTIHTGVDFVQEKFMGAGDQSNESAVEQAKDEQISDFIRGQYKSTTGSDIPIKDKETRFG